MKCDYHLHSEFSDDSDTPMEQQVERAIALGLDEMCFTDHVDYGIKKDWNEPDISVRADGTVLANVDYPRYFARLAELRRVYGGRIAIRGGLEFGMQQHTVPRYEALYEKYRDELDFVLLSVHQVEDREFWTQEFQRGRTQDEYNLRYYEEVLALTRQYHHYSVLAHLDLLVRYDEQGVYPFAKIRDIVAEIMTTAIRDGKGIELNTSSWHYGLADTQPSRDILRLYRDLGGRILTIGSDAHTPKYVADHMDDARAILRDEIGFTEFCTFERMEPKFHKL
ncbi:MAG: histidinol-phosphatase HisJ family protein [Oscillospiraceae bacterium]|nr:histidinol-phosphatase HisJ family protein [Oscillospiraceae bacterium]